MKKANGITLVSLVVTIIVLIILAGVSITSTLGENGIITIAKQAKENIELSKIEEQTKLNELYRQITIEETDLGNTGTIEGVQLKQVLEEISNLQQRIIQVENETKTIDDIYPVGSIYMTTDIYSAEEMSSTFGGTWESYAQGRTIIGVGTGIDENNEQQTFIVNQIGGEYNHTLTIEEMPSHSHKYKRDNFISNSTQGNWAYAAIGTTYDQETTSVGGNQKHNNIQPYMVTYIWKRVA